MIEFDRTSLLAIFRDSTAEQLAGQLDSLAQLLGERDFRRQAAHHLVLFARPETAIPASLGRFAPLVRDGIEFFLSQISSIRLRKVLVSLSSLRDSEEPGERLLRLALRFPTLHKLGQVIARNPHLDPAVKKWLVGLEQGSYGTDPYGQVRFIRRQLEDFATEYDIDLQPHILAEASVATVLPFSYRRPGSDRQGKGVFKVLKPGIADDLGEELEILADTFQFLEENRERYGLQEMKLSGIFQEIRGDMAREVDLAAEQEHLAEAVLVYDKVAGVRIPQPAPFSTAAMTSMEYIDGQRIGDASLTRQQRRVLARLIFEAVLCVPLFAGEELALFHGDPHAGNILIVPGSDPKSFDVALLDWTLAGHLAKKQRALVMELLLGVMKNDSRALVDVIESLASATEEEKISREQLALRIKALLASKEYLACDPLKKSFLLLETMTLEGVVFPSELILFRKSFFTLEGVLHDISAGFAMGEAMELYLGRLLLQELPQRCGTWMTAAADNSEEYRTLLSNRDLQDLSLHQAIALWQQAMRRNSSLFESQMRLLTDLFVYFSGSHYWYGRSSR
jgi:ubiquinone biosynthesis protein